jgi:acyl-CoA thioesterase-1
MSVVMKGKIALERGRIRYASAALLLQALLLAGCNSEPTVPADPISNMAEAAPPVVPAPAGPERLVLAFGDSLYAGYGLGRGQSLPDAVQARLRTDGINAKFVNAGVSGDTTADGRQRLAFALDNLPRKPDLVMLGLGGNDTLRQIAPAETRANLAAMLDELKRRKIPVLLTGMKAPPNLGPDYVGAFDRIWPDLAAQYKVRLYPFILDGVIGHPDLIQGDHIHPNVGGVTVIAGGLTPVVAASLKSAAGDSSK